MTIRNDKTEVWRAIIGIGVIILTCDAVDWAHQAADKGSFCRVLNMLDAEPYIALVASNISAQDVWIADNLRKDLPKRVRDWA